MSQNNDTRDEDVERLQSWIDVLSVKIENLDGQDLADCIADRAAFTAILARLERAEAENEQLRALLREAQSIVCDAIRTDLYERIDAALAGEKAPVGERCCGNYRENGACCGNYR
jgi:hypothetical protein